MNYEKIYYSIVNRAKIRIIEGYTENHHIIPKCIGGGDSKDNIVTLTAREHFICHWLLIKIHKNNLEKYKKMLYAMNMMKAFHKHDRYLNSRVFEQTKLLLYGENGLSSGENHPCYGKKYDDEHKKKLSESRKEMFKNNPDELQRVKNLSLNRSKEHQDKIAESNRGQKRSKESRKKMSDVHIGLQVGSKNGMSKQVCVGGKIYESVGLALEESNLKRGTLYFRVNSPNYTDYYYID